MKCKNNHTKDYKILNPTTSQWVYCNCEYGQVAKHFSQKTEAPYIEASTIERKYPKRVVAQYNGVSISDVIKAEKEEELRTRDADADMRDLMESIESNYHRRYD